jgi:hypothetical protein
MKGVLFFGDLFFICLSPEKKGVFLGSIFSMCRGC